MQTAPLHFAWKSTSAAARFRSGVSLHSHTSFSQEVLDFIPRVAAKVPVLKQAVEFQMKKYEKIWGHPLKFDHAWWTPPLTPKQALELETAQIERELGLSGLVSITDHDTIDAPIQLSLMGGVGCVPVSVEWTVPFGPTFFHLGIHNIPYSRASEVMRILKECTAAPKAECVLENLRWLHEMPEVLTVWNHPLWDEVGIGQARHWDFASQFCRYYRDFLHAFELNGLRPWTENSAVIEFAEEAGKNVVSGGDRHGCEPNAILNLSQAATFVEFVDEVRSGYSEVMFMKQYHEPNGQRILHTLMDVLRDYPHFPEGRRRWSDRVMFRTHDGQVKALSSFWNGNEPKVVKAFVSGVRMLDSQRVRGALRIAFAQKPEVTT